VKSVCLAAAVIAAGMIVSAPASAQNFNGLRAQVHAGWDRLSAEDDEFGIELAKSGVAYGAGLGYDAALGGGLVAGVEANFDLASTRARASEPGLTATVRARRDIELSGRIGAAVAPNVLLYAKAGYSNARFRAELVGGGITERESGTEDGLRLGGGIELALGGNAFAKAEYRYTTYGDGVSRNQLIGGFGFRF
jgi:outer membrane immunogenic protein